MNTKDNFMLVKNQRVAANQRLSAKAKRRLEKAKAEAEANREVVQNAAYSN